MYRYELFSTGAGSARHAPCEVCGESVTACLGIENV